MALADFHNHSFSSFDGEQTMEEICEKAIREGMDAVAITDHADLASRFQPTHAEIDDAYEKMTAVKAAYAGRLRVAKGVELGQALYALPEADWILSRHAYDVVLASLHFVDGSEDFYSIDYRSLTVPQIEALFERYFGELLRLTKWGRFQVLAHMTYALRYVPKELGIEVRDTTRFYPLMDPVLDELIRTDKALEINVAGLRSKDIGYASPELPVVKRYRERGGKYITFGTDSHRNDSVGQVEEAKKIASLAGFDAVTVYFDGKPELLAF